MGRRTKSGSGGGKTPRIDGMGAAKTELNALLAPLPDVRLPGLVASVETAQATCNTTKQKADAAEKAALGAEKNAQTVAAQSRADLSRLQTAQEAQEAAPAADAAPPAPAFGAGAGFAALSVAAIIAAVFSGLWLLFGVAAVLLLGAGAALITGQKKAHGEALRLYVERQEKQQAQAKAARESTRKETGRLQDLVDQAQTAAHTARQAAVTLAKAYHESLLRLADAERDLASHRAASDYSGRLPGLRDTLRRAEDVLRTLSLPLPQSAAEAQIQAGTAPAQSRADLRKNTAAAQKAHGEAQTLLSQAEKGIVRHLPRFTFTDEEKQTALGAPQLLKNANLPLDLEAVRTALGRAERDKNEAQRITNTLPACETARDKAVQNTQTQKAAFHHRLDLPNTDSLFPKLRAGDAPPTLSDASNLLTQMNRELHEGEAEQDAALVASSLSVLRNETESISQKEGVIMQEMAGLQASQAAPRQTLALASPSDAPLGELLTGLREAHPHAVHNTAEAWQAQIHDAQMEEQSNRASRTAHAGNAGITDALLDEAVEQTAFNECVFARSVHAAARNILNQTRDAILNRVMPGTLVITKRILPLLTDSRYRDVRWDMANNLIEVMDARKGDWAMKRVFSGGTRDQISLALRLSFVLATLPNTKATRPGWLFLDEPLSSFDAARSESLIKLLTQGNLIRPRFPQIFLISHGTAADPSRFDYHLIMDGGKINPASRLPAP